MPRRKHVQEHHEVTAWPSSFPEDIGESEPHGSGESLDSDELGSHFMTDVVEHARIGHEVWEGGPDEEPFDARKATAILRSFGLKPMPKRHSSRPSAHPTATAQPAFEIPKLSQPRVPRDLHELLGRTDDVNLTEQSIRDGSMFDREGREPGEVRCPSLITDDVHTHGKRRGGHARSTRPPKHPRLSR